MVPVIPGLVAKELVVALVLLAFVFVFSLLINAPLMEKADPSNSPDPAKAPWYFLGIQELIVHLHPYFSVFLIPAFLILAAILFPYTKQKPVEPGIWFISTQTRRNLLITLLFTCIFIPAWIIADEYLLDFHGWIPAIPFWISEGLFPFFIFTGIVYLAGNLRLSRFRLPLNELVMHAFVFFGTAYVLLMVTGIFFRGAGMELVLPF